jgi:hypothetical protein
VANTETLCIRVAFNPAERPEADGAEGSPSDDRGRATTGGIIAQGASGEPARSTQLAAEAITGVPWCRVPPAPLQFESQLLLLYLLSVRLHAVHWNPTSDDHFNAGTLTPVLCPLHVQCVLV